MVLIFLFYFFLKACMGFCLENWSTEQLQVLERAKLENKMILLACVGGDFCPWSQKMVHEILDREAFIKSMKDEVVLWRVTLHAEADRNEEKWRKRWHIEQCPTLLLLDPQGKEFARFGYLPLEQQEYASQLLQTLRDFKILCKTLQGQSNEDWLVLYQKAKKFSSFEFKKTLLERAEKQNPAVDVLLEKYLLLIEKKGFKHASVKKCRKEIFRRDPADLLKTHFKIALGEFHLLEEKAEYNAEKVIRPLKRFAENFGSRDPENLWKAQWEIATYLFTKHKISEARKWAARAVQHAPEEEKASIIQAISDES